MNMLLPEKFIRVGGADVRVVILDIRPLSEDYGLSSIVLSVLRDMARDTGIIIDFSDDIINETTLSDKRIEDALAKTDADLLVFGSYLATRSNVQPMIHMVCTYGRSMEESYGLLEKMDLNQAIVEGDAILQLPRHLLMRDIMPLMALETLSFQNSLAAEIFHIARFIQALKLYKAEQFKESIQVVNSIVTNLSSPEDWPVYWAPYSYIHMLAGLGYLRLGETQSAVYTLSNAIARSTPAKMRVQRCAEQILASLLQPAEEQGAEAATSGE